MTEFARWRDSIFPLEFHRRNSQLVLKTMHCEIKKCLRERENQNVIKFEPPLAIPN